MANHPNRGRVDLSGLPKSIGSESPGSMGANRPIARCYAVLSDGRTVFHQAPRLAGGEPAQGVLAYATYDADGRRVAVFVVKPDGRLVEVKDD